MGLLYSKKTVDGLQSEIVRLKDQLSRRETYFNSTQRELNKKIEALENEIKDARDLVVKEKEKCSRKIDEIRADSNEKIKIEQERCSRKIDEIQINCERKIKTEQESCFQEIEKAKNAIIEEHKILANMTEKDLIVDIRMILARYLDIENERTRQTNELLSKEIGELKNEFTDKTKDIENISNTLVEKISDFSEQSVNTLENIEKQMSNSVLDMKEVLVEEINEFSRQSTNALNMTESIMSNLLEKQSKATLDELNTIRNIVDDIQGYMEDGDGDSIISNIWIVSKKVGELKSMVEDCASDCSRILSSISDLSSDIEDTKLAAEEAKYEAGRAKSSADDAYSEAGYAKSAAEDAKSAVDSLSWRIS